MLEWNRFESSKWRQFQSVFAGFCFRRIAERRDNGLRFMPVGELVGVVAAADLAGFASGNEQNGVIPVGEVGDEAHRRAVAFCCGAHAVTGTGLRFARDAEQ